MSNNDKQISNSIQLFPRENFKGMSMLKSQTQIVFPPGVDNYYFLRRLTATTSVPLNVQLDTMEIDFQLQSYNGHLKELYAEIGIVNLSSSTSAVFNPYKMFNRIDVEINGQLFHSYYPDELWYGQVIFRNLLENNRVRTAEGMQGNYTPDSPVIPASGTRNFLLKLPIFTSPHVDLRQITGIVMLRFFIDTPNYWNSSTTQLGFTQFNLIEEIINTPIMNLNIDKYFRYNNFVRFTNTLSMSANNQYVQQLNSLIGNASMIMIMLRPSPTSTFLTNWQNLVNLNLYNVSLYDETNNLVAIAQYDLLNRHILNKALPGDFFDNGSTPYIYTIIHAVNPAGSPDQQTGFYNYNTKQNIYINTLAGFSSSSYELTVWAIMLDHYCIKKNGEFSFTR
jgi:hypothetical protein